MPASIAASGRAHYSPRPVPRYAGREIFEESPPMRIAVLHFSHETVTFLANDTTLADFTYPGSPAKGDEVLAMQPRDYIGGFVQVAREYADVELVGIESPGFPVTGTGSGWITEEAFETFVGRMIAELSRTVISEAASTRRPPQIRTRRSCMGQVT